ncbi:MAG: DUF1036 domain-containing protein [Hyphomonadaceae bacterium]|nr:DUF1036 domain-containing protein [Hyphomonadaceae bacterium]
MALVRSSIKRGVAALLGVAAFAAAIALVGDDAEAQQRQQRQQRQASGWQICNETSFVLEAATARPEGRTIQVQGWTRLRPGECRVAVSAPLARGTHYLYARSSAAHRGGRRQWGGDAPICVDPSDQFQIENPPRCTEDYEARRFRRVLINKRDSWRTTFSEAFPYSLARARQVGLQRLLDDAGYDLREGRRNADPRRIAQALAQFRATQRLAPNLSEDQLIDALETAARRRAGQVGLTLCNRTRSRLWTAVGRRRGEGWESRGWWALNANGCVRTIDEVLTQDRYYVYASMETNEGARYLAEGEPFCTSPARFAILGRGSCDSRYFTTDLFSPIRTREREGLVVEFEERDFLAPGIAPRQLTPTATDLDATPANNEPPRRGLAPQAAPATPAAPTQDRPTP